MTDGTGRWWWPGRRFAMAVLVGTLGGAPAAYLEAQTVDIRGVVRDSVSHEALPSAVVTLADGRRTLTDQYGRFSLVNLTPGVFKLRVEYFSYAPKDMEVTVPLAAALVVEMRAEAFAIEGITVETSTELVQPSEEVSVITISPRKLSALPSLGETDVFRAIQLLPGVGGTNDATSGLFVRGGTPDENLVLLDGMTVYHVDHFFGVFSAFNADAVKDVRLYKGGFPAQYGGRTSSVVDMIGKTGDNQRVNVSAGLNLLSARAVTEVPLGDRGSWLLSFRRSYTDVIRSGLYDNIFNTLNGGESTAATPAGPGGGPPGGFGGRGNFAQQTIQPDFYFYDLNSKLTYEPTSSDVVSVSVYSGADNLDQSALGGEFTLPNGSTRVSPDRLDKSRWGNLGVSGRWSRQWGARLTTNALAAYSEYFSRGDVDVASAQLAQGFHEDNNVADFTLRLDNSLQLAPGSTVGFGLESTNTDVQYVFQRIQGDSIRGALDLGGEGTLTAGYVQHRWNPTDRVDVTLGLRGSRYDQTGENYLEPRASAQFKVTDRVRLKGAWGLYNQFVKRVENEDITEGSRDFWLLSGDRIPTSSAEHRIVGASYEMPMWLFDVEAYQKVLDGVSQFSTRSRQTPGQALDELFFTGTGDARGLEVLAQKKQGRLTGWVGYTLSKVEYELADFNGGDPFPASQDQRHEVNVVASYQVGPWTFSSTWVYGSGKPYTVPEGQYPITTLDGGTLNFIHVGDKNGHRLPAYHRLDVSAIRRFEVGRVFYEVNASVFNAYGRSNVWYRKFDLSENPMLITDVTTLGFTPSIGVRVGLR